MSDYASSRIYRLRRSGASRATRGRGAYSLGKAWRATVGKQAGRKIRDAAVNQVVSRINALGGRGLYQGGRGLYQGGRGSYNNLIAGGRKSMRVRGRMDETQTITISHSEYLQDIYGPSSSGFSVLGFQLNPGLVERFPWLSQIACNYEEYEFIQLLFHYKSTVDPSATSNTSGATGTIVLATNYNPSSPLFTGKDVMMQYHGAQSGRVTEDHTHGVECDPKKNAGSGQKFVRTLPVLISQDLKTYDLGTFQIGLVNVPAAFKDSQIGELWVTYTVKLTKPRMYASIGGLIQEWRCANSVNSVAPVTAPFGVLSDLSVMLQSSLAMRFVQNTTAAGVPINNQYILTFPDHVGGLFRVVLRYEGLNTAPMTVVAGNMQIGSAVINGVTVTSNIQEYPDMLVGGAAGDAPTTAMQGGSGTVWIMEYHYRVQPSVGGLDNYLIISAPSVTAGTLTMATLDVSEMNPFLASPTQDLPTYVNATTGQPVSFT